MASMLLCICLITAFATVANSKCISGELCWPDSKTWADFNATISGRLIAVSPPASPCHDPRYDETACTSARSSWNMPFWRSDQPGSMQRTSWEWLGDQRCLISSNRTATCFQGSLPVYAVNVSHPVQVQESVKFALLNNLRLVIRNTGHDFFGRSTATGSLSIWIHYLKDMQFHNSFTPCGGVTEDRWRSSALTVGAGVQWEQIYKAAQERELVVVGATCSSVGAAGGYPQGGGHSPLSPLLGLSADNILQYELVTADGRLVRANACQNSDLFWALRGGGGGTFGVVISATHKTYPAFDNLIFAPYDFLTTNRSAFQELLTLFTRLTPSLTDSGWGGYFLSSSRTLTLAWLLPNRSLTYAATSLGPLLSYARENSFQVTGSLQEFESYWDWHLQVQCGGQPSCSGVNSLGVTDVVASRLIPRELFTAKDGLLARAMMTITERTTVQLLVGIMAGGQVNRVRVQENAVNPAWRKSLWLLTTPLLWGESPSVGEMRAAAKAVSFANKVLIDITPGSGTYMNEADYNEPDWQQSFYGENYRRLYNIKQMVDPLNLFTCHYCVGSEKN